MSLVIMKGEELVSMFLSLKEVLVGKYQYAKYGSIPKEYYPY